MSPVGVDVVEVAVVRNGIDDGVPGADHPDFISSHGPDTPATGLQPLKGVCFFTLGPTRGRKTDMAVQYPGYRVRQRGPLKDSTDRLAGPFKAEHPVHVCSQIAALGIFYAR